MICIVELRDENIKVIIIAFYAVKNLGERIDHVKEKYKITYNLSKTSRGKAHGA